MLSAKQLVVDFTPVISILIDSMAEEKRFVDCKKLIDE
jgi:hypothetical protein